MALPLLIKSPLLKSLSPLASIQKGGAAYYLELRNNADPLVAAGAWCTMLDSKLMPRALAPELLGFCRYGGVRSRAFAHFQMVHEHRNAQAAAATPLQSTGDLLQAAMLAELAQDH